VKAGQSRKTKSYCDVGRERLCEVALAVGALRKLDDGTGEVGLRRDEVEVRNAVCCVSSASGAAVEQVVARSAVPRASPSPEARSPAGSESITSERFTRSRKDKRRG